ncbi:hypothetical protein HDV05_000653 [Chytridiales sp. JEL 0842]|nr:hypothetical protein HDV05_000653 [Chytridiales sp. JEL 0842]
MTLATQMVLHPLPEETLLVLLHDAKLIDAYDQDIPPEDNLPQLKNVHDTVLPSKKLTAWVLKYIGRNRSPEKRYDAKQLGVILELLIWLSKIQGRTPSIEIAQLVAEWDFRSTDEECTRRMLQFIKELLLEIHGQAPPSYGKSRSLITVIDPTDSASNQTNPISKDDTLLLSESVFDRLCSEILRKDQKSILRDLDVETRTSIVEILSYFENVDDNDSGLSFLEEVYAIKKLACLVDADLKRQIEIEQDSLQYIIILHKLESIKCLKNDRKAVMEVASLRKSMKQNLKTIDCATLVEQILDSDSIEKATLLRQISILTEQEEDTASHADIDNESYFTKVVGRLAELLVIPRCFDVDTDYVTDPALRKVIHTFREQAVDVFRLIFAFLSGCDLKEKLLRKIAIPIAAFLGDKKGRCNEAIKSVDALFLECLLRLLKKWSLMKTTKPDNVLREFLNTYSPKILNEAVKPYFIEPRVDAFGNKSKQHVQSDEDSSTFDSRFEEQPWKSVRVDCVEILEWITFNTKFPDILAIQHLIIPPILTMVDDYDPKYKERGIKLMHHALITNSTPNDIRRTGLSDVLFDALCICLTFHSDPSLLRCALPVSVELATLVEVQGSEASFKKLERIAEDGVVKGLKMAFGGNVEVIRAFLEVIPLLSQKMGVMIIRHLGPLMNSCTELLEVHRWDITTQILAVSSIKALFETCWPRIPDYGGQILSACATAWWEVSKDEPKEERDNRQAALKNVQDRKVLRSKLVELVMILVDICGETLKCDIDSLLELDKELFGPLLP